MLRRSIVALVGAGGIALAGCGPDSRPDPSAPEVPSLAKAASPFACNPTGLSTLISAYFNPPQQQTVKALVDALLALPPSSPEREAKGFEVLAQVELAAQGGAPAAAGNTFVREVLKCTFDVSNSTNFPDFNSGGYDFTVSLDKTLGGGFGVRFPDATSSPVSGVLDGSVVGALAPPAAAQWDDILAAPALIFGFPGAAGGTYDWSKIPRNVDFAPLLAVVTTCAGDDANFQTVLHESSVGVLAFVDAGYLCGAPVGTFQFGWGPSDVAKRLAALVLPEKAYATALLASAVGGSAGGLRSLFTPSATIATVATEFQGRVADTRVGEPTPVTVLVTAVDQLADGSPGPFDGAPVAGTEVRLFAINNNGDKLPLGGASAVTDKDGLANFQVEFNKTGGVSLIVDVDGSHVIERDGITVGFSESNKFNVRP